jgi:hypothetical protein
MVSCFHKAQSNELSHIVIHIFYRSAPFESGVAIFMRFRLKIGKKVGILYQTHQFCVRRHAVMPRKIGYKSLILLMKKDVYNDMGLR